MSRLVMVLTVSSNLPGGRLARGNYTAVTDENGSNFPEEALIDWMLANSVDPLPPGATPWRVVSFSAAPVEDGPGVEEAAQ